jgi:hypothetical protein
MRVLGAMMVFYDGNSELNGEESVEMDTTRRMPASE